VGNIAREGVQNMLHWSGVINDATDEWLLQWLCDSVRPTQFSFTVSVYPYQLCIFCTPSFEI